MAGEQRERGGRQADAPAREQSGQPSDGVQALLARAAVSRRGAPRRSRTSSRPPRQSYQAGPRPRRSALLRLVRPTPPLELAQHYVQTFDLGKRSALYLTFYSARRPARPRAGAAAAQEALSRRRTAARRQRAARLPAGDARVRRGRARGTLSWSCASSAPRSSSSASRSANSTAPTPCSRRGVRAARRAVGYRAAEPRPADRPGAAAGARRA